MKRMKEKPDLGAVEIKGDRKRVEYKHNPHE